MSELKARYVSDPDYRAMVDRQEAELQARRDALRRAEQPLASDLNAAGIPVESAWDLYEHPDLGEIAYPILLTHLAREYPDRILEGIAREFRKDVVRKHWRELLDLYLDEVRPAVSHGLAATLSQYAVRAHYEDLVSIVERESLGETRIYFLRPVNRIGNRIETGKGRAVIERWANDSQLGREAIAILQGRGHND